MIDHRENHRRLILDQFTRQPVPFAEMPAHSHDEADRLLLELAAIGPDDTVLDVACGPGLVACRLAKIARHVTGIDLTPAMIELAQARQRSAGLENLTWLAVSPVNKGRPEARRALAAKCDGYLQRGIGLVIVDIVTERQANLHKE